jgi:hypothetical protein
MSLFEEDEPGVQLTINKAFANRYQARKEKEDLSNLKQVLADEEVSAID